MGARGPRPTPTAVLAARGSKRAAQRARTEPVADFTPPPCPTWLDETARLMWKELCPRLSGMSVLARTDANVLARYCRLWSRWRKMEDAIEEHGEVFEGVSSSGATYLTVRPEVSIAANLAALLAKLEAELAITPAARTRVNVGGGGGDDGKRKAAGSAPAGPTPLRIAQ